MSFCIQETTVAVLEVEKICIKPPDLFRTTGKAGAGVLCAFSVPELFLSFPTVRDRVRTKIERDILADVNHPFVVKLHYGE